MYHPSVRELSNLPVIPPIGSPMSKLSDNTEKFEEEERKIMETEITEDEEEITEGILSENSNELIETTIEEIVEEESENEAAVEMENDEQTEDEVTEVLNDGDDGEKWKCLI